ncbi:hypothetical protein Gogos_003534 [Gossypium gossypioides]|uniref:Uncharacterized protein n=1 Tax=Gossypium gossypioides TaxID=34282 RepID=A0A7J9CMB2_GOSGO|nr:hypothetical protein [Gossypium gossypioides]
MTLFVYQNTVRNMSSLKML